MVDVPRSEDRRPVPSAPMRRALLLFVPLALVVAACGDSDDGASSAPAEDWCGLAAEFEAVGDGFDALEPSDPDGIRDLFDGASALLDRARASAPEEISDDVDTFADGFGELDSALRDVDFNIFDVDLSVLEDSGDRIDAANDAIEAYNERECGIAPEPDDADDDADDESDFDPSAGSVREQLADQFVQQGFSEGEATCLAESIDPAMLQEGDQTAILEIFDTCDIDIARLAELFG